MRCLGCGITSVRPKADNWELWQLCYHCAKLRHPEHYKDKPDHGVGGKYLKPAEYHDFNTIELKTFV